MTDDLIKIFVFNPTIQDRLITRESTWLEFKQGFNWGDREKYVKSFASFANNRGGFIVYGVKDKPHDLVGLTNNNFDNFDEARVSEFLNANFSPEIEFEKISTQIEGKEVGLFKIKESKNKPVVCIRSGEDIKEGEIYYRYSGRSEKIKYPELRNLLDGIREKERALWSQYLEKISKISPEDSAILNLADGKMSGSNSSLLIDESLLDKISFIKEGSFDENGLPTLKLIGEVKPIAPDQNQSNGEVVITDNPAAPKFQLDDSQIVKQYPLDYAALCNAMRDRYTDFKIDSKFQNLKTSLEKNPMLCFYRYLNPKNKKGTCKKFYSGKILDELDKFYTKESS